MAISALFFRIKFPVDGSYPPILVGELFFFRKKVLNVEKKILQGMICMICTGNLILRTLTLEYFNNSLYISKIICAFLVKFGFYSDTKRLIYLFEHIFIAVNLKDIFN